MDSMSLKKRKLDTYCSEDGRPRRTTPDTPSTTAYTNSNCFQSFPRDSPFQESYQYNKLPPSSSNLYQRAHIAPVTPSKKRRLEQKILHIQHSPKPITSDEPKSSVPTLPTHFRERNQKLPPTYRIHLRDEYGLLQQPNTIQTPTIHKRDSSDTLAPCHICHRRPTTRTVLDAYADCELCGGRACYVCLRECNNPTCRDTTLPTISDSGNSRQTPNCDDDMCWIPENKRTSEPGGDRVIGTHADTLGRKICSLCAVEAVTGMGTETVRCLVCVERKSEVT